MTSARDKALLGVGGVAAAGILAWRTMFPWIGYDLEFIRKGKKATDKIGEDIKKQRFLIDMFEEKVTSCPRKPFLIFEDRIYTYEFMNEQAKRVANIAMTWGFKLGETVALFINNEPSFIWTFLGLQKIGLGVAFINYHIRAKALLHSIKACEARALIIGLGEDLFHAIDEIRHDLDIPLYLQGDNIPDGYKPWDEMMINTLPSEICRNVRAEFHLFTPCCYIFTSGTTGLPKPAIVNQAKAIGYSKFFTFSEISKDDIIYITTPLYHSAACLSLFSTMDVGSTALLRRKFSAHHYFKEARRHKVTIMQYIGELPRYLLTVPESSEDGIHNIRIAIGNGLRMDIWEKFQNRFKIPKIVEFFGATEGTAAMANIQGRVGAVGRMSPFLIVFLGTGEPGILIAAIPITYSDGFYKGGKEINEKKIVRNAFVDGDAFFNFGDLLVQDKDYFVYFKDRVGDTFRWKGENVSTNEVANVLTGLDVIQDANVYGVQVPGTDGRAGMAAILLKNGKQVTESIVKQIYHHCEENLPSFARPIFLRFIKEMALTTTYKQRKVENVKEGFDPNKIKDELFYIHPESKSYLPLTATFF
ncbi:hypothetical protein KUTeg_017581 [Tegillarca granosa]|uniref:Long-chain-fatty-acid--CoA ligase n=1 Tax=Tegillarca granosa TaxID=220873 RepID=A0ABQ9EFB8_TEGGR|nr:hypothetical protein KUTeg_017581 [Tegillarca granosa]